MYKIKFYTGYASGRTRVYKTFKGATEAIFNNIDKMFMYYKICCWMKDVEGSNKSHNLTVENTIRIEYTPY